VKLFVVINRELRTSDGGKFKPCLEHNNLAKMNIAKVQ